MKLNIVLRKRREGTVQINLFGPVVIGPGAEALTNVFDVLLGKYDQIVVDMAQVNRLDARGIGCLVWAYAEGGAKGTRVSLRNLPPLVREVLVIVKLIAVFDGPGTDDLPKAA